MGKALNTISKTFNSIFTGAGEQGRAALNSTSGVIGSMFESAGAQVGKAHYSLFGNDAMTAGKIIQQSNSSMKQYAQSYKTAQRDYAFYKQNPASTSKETLMNAKKKMDKSKNKFIASRTANQNAQNALDSFADTQDFIANNQKAIGAGVVGAGALGVTGAGIAAYSAYNS